jgi:Mn2+/Fe2+ NRAMP family transporter
MKEWFNGLTRQQAGVLGGVAGYALGVVTGPILRLLFAVGVLIMFGLLGRHIERRFEKRLGAFGIVAAILACTSMGPIQRWAGDLLGGIISNTSKLAFAILGVYLVLQLHETSVTGKNYWERGTTDSGRAETDPDA